MSEASVLLVEPDQSMALAISSALREHEYSVEITSDAEGALRSIEKAEPRVVVAALHLPERSGMALLSTVKSRWPPLPFVLLVAVKEMAIMAEAIRKGASKVLSRPPQEPELLEAVQRAIEENSAEPLSASTTGIIGNSPDILKARKEVSLAAKMGGSTLITGESGTGKELAIGAVHRLSARGSRRLIVVNCASLAPHLWEESFFGHRKGTFTGAHEDRVGMLEEADGSHILLDELQSLSIDLQAKFLRVIEDGEVRPLGSHEVRTVSIRFIAATNKDPEWLMAEGILREDLYYRLADFEIRMPPLRDHLEDIPLLVAHFLRGTEFTMAQDAIEALQAETWRGNVRELRSRIKRARVVASDSKRMIITLTHVMNTRPEPRGTREPHPAAESGCSFQGTLREIERQAIADTLRRVGWNQSEAARRLGIRRRTLWAKLRRLGICLDREAPR